MSGQCDKCSEHTWECKCGSKKGTLLTYPERKQIQKLLSLGHSCGQISNFIGRSKNLVVVEIRRAGGKETYNAKKAQEISDKNKDKKYRALSKKNKGNQYGKLYRDQLQNLQMQLDIILDVLKEIKNDKKKQMNTIYLNSEMTTDIVSIKCTSQGLLIRFHKEISLNSDLF